MLADILASIATSVASAGSAKSPWFVWDEPECPENLL